MENSSVIGTLFLIITGIITFKGLRDKEFFERYLFEVDGILIDGEYRRLVSSGFLHSGWLHFGFNMIALLSFSMALEIMFGFWKFVGLYFFSLIGGNALALYIHRHHGDYRAVGASGAISGVIFSSIILFPESSISFVILPISIKSWIFGLLFIVISIFGIKSQSDNIGHEAHLGGALAGVLATIAIDPSVLLYDSWIILALVIPTTAFLILIARNPAVLMVNNYWGETLSRIRNADFSMGREETVMDKEEELDRLLDKIRHQGFDSLSRKERSRLDELRDEFS